MYIKDKKICNLNYIYFVQHSLLNYPNPFGIIKRKAGGTTKKKTTWETEEVMRTATILRSASEIAR